MNKSENSNFITRKAKREDASKICELINELAAFENCLDSVKISAKQLEEDGFGKAPAYGCFVAENPSGNVINFALYFSRYSTWYGRGIGRELIKVAKQKFLKRIDFHVLKWNPAKEFYRKLGAVNFTENEDYDIYHIYENTIQQLAQI